MVWVLFPENLAKSLLRSPSNYSVNRSVSLFRPLTVYLFSVVFREPWSIYSLIPQLYKGLLSSSFLWSDVISFITLYITDFVQKAPVFLSQLHFHLLGGKDHTLDSWAQAVTGIVLDLLYRLIGGPLNLSYEWGPLKEWKKGIVINHTRTAGVNQDRPRQTETWSYLALLTGAWVKSSRLLQGKEHSPMRIPKSSLGHLRFGENHL